MKRTVLNAIILLLAVSLFSFTAKSEYNPAADAMPTISFESQVLDYGDILQNSDGTRIFKFQNTGDAPLVISKVKSSCGCTVPSYSKDPILPGESGEIKIKYNTSKLGAFTKSVVVTSNTEEGTTTLKIKGNVVFAEK